MLALEQANRRVPNPMILRYECAPGHFLLDLAHSRFALFKDEEDITGFHLTGM
jgi:hypothetical protein